MTDDYDNDNVEHRRIRLGIEQGNGISNMVTISEGIRAMKAAGFELVLNEDLAQRPDPRPWYYPIDGDFSQVGSFFDIFTIARMTWWGRGLAHKFMRALEIARLAPAGTQKSADNLAVAADNLVAGAKLNLFTPMYLMVGKKPEA